MATIKDVARMAGVSMSTVSKYMNGGHVREENVESIRKAIEALDYRVNPFARRLKTQRSRSIGILLPDITAPFFGAVVTALDKSLRECGYHTIMSCYSANHGMERDNLHYLISTGIDGLIYIPEDLSAEEYYE
ncbi:LacI family DNA-binding transcriptional regulator, partial [Vibrio sp. FNV 38]|nr:LacI family DNA-binding transcriptional regulator [Vibrio sp. FNV 38]